MSNRNFIRFFWFVLLLQILPVLLLGENAYIRIHDTLEGELNWYHMLNLSGLGLDLSSDATVPQIMNGQPRITLHSPMNLTYWFMHTLGIYWGYLLQKFILVGIAFIGMYLMVKDEIDDSNSSIAIGLGAIYACIPFYSVFGCSFAGIPLAVWAFLRILRSAHSWYHVAILLFFPFWSSIVWAAPSILLLFFIYTFIYWKRDKFSWAPWLVMAFMASGYLLSNYPLISTMLNPPNGFVSHREVYDFSNFKPFSVQGSFTETVYSVFLGQYHVGTFFTGVIWMVVLTAILLRKCTFRALIWSVLALSFFTGFYGLVILLLAEHISLVETFRFDRIRMLLPFLYLVLLGKALFSLYADNLNWKRTAHIVIALQLMITLFLNDEFIHNLRQLTGLESKPNYKTYFDTALLTQVEEHIGINKSDYRVIHLGMNPAISQHHGFYTLDGLQSVYSLEHKERFRRIIQKELEKNSTINEYFTLWGNRCYLFSSELGKEDGAFLIPKDSDLTVKELEVQTEMIKEMGGKYVFSGLEVENAVDLGWQLDGVFSLEHSYYRIYLYKL